MDYAKIVVMLNNGEHRLEMDVRNLSWTQQCRKVDSLRKQIPICKELRKMGGQPTWGRRMIELGPNGKRSWDLKNRIDLI